MDEVTRTVIDGNGFGGLGAGGTLGLGAIGGLVLGSLWNGNGWVSVETMGIKVLPTTLVF